MAWNYSAADRTFDFLAAGQTLTITYALTIADGHGGSVVQNVVETITGTNDAPSIVASAHRCRPAHLPMTTTGPTGPNGSIGFADVDLSDHHTLEHFGTLLFRFVWNAVPPWRSPGSPTPVLWR